MIVFFGDKSSRFNRFDMFCIAVVAAILIFWFFTQNHFVTNLLVQGILVVAYFPVVSRIVKTKQNHENYLIWTGMLLAALLAMPISEGQLALIYTGRAVVCILLLMGLMLVTDLKNRSKIFTEKTPE
jgi:hypothetical protein